MDSTDHITPPLGEHDTDGALRAAQSFSEVYEVTLVWVENYLGQVIGDAGPEYAEAYLAWYQSLHDLIEGINRLTRNPVELNEERFTEALRIFSFDGAIQFLENLLISSKVKLEKNWHEKFREHIHIMLSATQVLRAQPA